MIDIKKPWAKLLLWVSGYVSAICYALVGGFVFLNCEDEELRAENKKVFVVSVIFLALSAFTALWSSLNGLFGASSEMFRAYSIFSSIISICKIVTFVVFAILALCSKDSEFHCCCHDDCECEDCAEEAENEEAEVGSSETAETTEENK